MLNGVTFKMVRVDGGTFTMGATADQGSGALSNEKPAHQVQLSDYCIGETEVTQALWLAVMGSNPSLFTSANGFYDNFQRPVERVSWNDCQEFVIRLNELTGMQFRLPTEAEWEYAARGGVKATATMYSGSGVIANVAWYKVNARDVGTASFDYGTHAVATKSPNELGLYDMSGNVWEWVYDWFGSYSTAQVDPTGPASGNYRVMRGGSWYHEATHCRLSNRGYAPPTTINSSGISGLRLAMSAAMSRPYAVVNGSTITFYFDTEQSTRQGTVFPLNSSFTSCPWSNSAVSTATFDASFSNYYPTSTAHWFDGCSSLSSITGISNLKTRSVIDMSYMFNGCYQLGEIDVSSFVTGAVTNMSYMFSGTNLEMLDMSSFDTGKVTDMSGMFSNCTNLTSLDLTGFDIGQVTRMDGMFRGSVSLATIICDDDWSGHTASAANMFSDCVSLVGGNCTYYSPNVVGIAYARPDQPGMAGYFTSHYINVTVNGVTFRMVRVDGGTFTMGATADQGSGALSNEKPAHQVQLSDYCIGETEVTQALWLAVMGSNPSLFTSANGFYDNFQRPVERVSWNDCQEFVIRLNELTGMQFRLPTEAEWEYAARGGVKATATMYSGSGVIANVAWYKVNARDVGTASFDYGTHAVATKSPNELGLYDMSGNVWEWVYDWFGSYSTAQVDPTGPASGNYRVMRGGSWYHEATHCRLSCRSYAPPTTTNSSGISGLRLVLGTAFSANLGNAYAVLNGSELTFYCDDQREGRQGTVYPIGGSFIQCPWASAGATRAIFDLSFANYYPTSTAHWFDGCTSLTEIVGIENLKTKCVIDMSYMFNGCSGLTEIDVSDFITEKATNMSYMFSNTAVETLDVSCFDTHNVTNLSGMFSGCANLKSLDVSGFDISHVVNMDEMFKGSVTLTTICCDKNWSGCSASSANMFTGCTSLVGGKGTTYNSSIVDKTYARPDQNSSAGYFTASSTETVDNGGIQAYTVLDNGVLTFYYDNLMRIRSGKKFNITANVGLTMPTWHGSRRDIKRAQFDASFADYRPTSTACWFYDCPSLTGIDSIHNLNTSQVTSMAGMFRFCRKLSTIDVTGFDTRNVTDMSFMFCYCEGLINLDVSNFVTDKVVNMEHMFHTCPLASLNLKNFNTAKVTKMNTMFNSCKQLTTVSVSDDWNTEAVTDGGSGMFSSCSHIVGSMGTRYSSQHINIAYAHIDGGTAYPGYLSDAIGDSEPYVVLADSALTFYYDPFRKNRTGTIYMIEEEDSYSSEGIPNWSNWYISRASFDESFADYRPQSTAYWFYRLPCLSMIDGLSLLNTSQVTNMEYMFCSCTNLTSLDVSNFNTSNVTDMSGMFMFCSSLSSLDVTNFNTSNVTSMYHMFYDCSSLTSLDVTNFNTSNVTDMCRLFSQCSRLTTLDLSNFNTSQVANMVHMFSDCYKLTALNLSNFNTSNVTNMCDMFHGCSSLTTLDVTSFNTSNVTDMSNMFYDCSSLTALNVTNFNTPQVTNMYRMFSGCRKLTSLDVTNFITSNVTNMSEMFYYCSSLTTLDLTNFNTTNVTDMYHMFYNCSSLTALDLTSFDTSNVTNMYEFFYDCSSLITLDLSNFNTSQVTNMKYMFSGCRKLASLDVTNFNTAQVTDMEHMFFNCLSLNTLDLSNFNTSQVTNMKYMFSGCRNLISLDLTNFNTSNVTNMYRMFYDCSSLTSLDVTNFNTLNVTNMSDMFEGCSSLTAINLTNFNTSNVTDMSGMFFDCSSLTSLDVTSFNTSNVTNMSSMFEACSSLKFIDLSSFDVWNVKRIYFIFNNCESLETIYVNNRWSLENLLPEYYTTTFYQCISLVGGAGTVYDPEHTDYTYAHVDGGESNPGYFTLKVLTGDADGDGIISIADVTRIIDYLLSGDASEIDLSNADVDGDGKVIIADVTELIDMLLNKV